MMCDFAACEECRNLRFLNCMDPSSKGGPWIVCNQFRSTIKRFDNERVFVFYLKEIELDKKASSRILPSRKRKRATESDITSKNYEKIPET